ncbi:MAG: hypothetical protein IKW83_09690 [Muribaculaceae bacterium]|nr:hypothetical protein [Muribaculaceae bacterium]
MTNQENSVAQRIRHSFSAGSIMHLLGEVLALALMATFAISVFEFKDATAIILSLTVAYLIPRFIYSRSRYWCRLGHWLLLTMGFLLAIYVVLSIKACTVDVGETLEEPELHSDSGSYYAWALSHYDGRCASPKLPFKGLPLLMLWQWKLFGVSVAWPLALNYMFTLLTIVMTGMVACRMLCRKFEDFQSSTIATAAMLLVSLMGFLISQGLRIQKEAGCALGLLLVGYTLAGMASGETLTKRDRNRDIAIFVTGCLLLSLVRTNFTYFAIVGAIMMSFSNRRAHWKYGALLTVIAAVFTVTFSIIFSYSFGQQYRTVDGGDAMALAFKVGIVQQPYFNIIGDYYHYPEWKRILLLPVTAGVQYVIPFPWLYDYSHATIFNLLPRFRLMWYFVGGACLHYFLYITILHPKSNNLGMWAWWPLSLFMIIAYITGGSVSRYALPLQPLFVIIALYVLLNVKRGNYRRSFTIWMIIYAFVMVAILVLCYNAQSEYLNNLDEYYRQGAALHAS